MKKKKVDIAGFYAQQKEVCLQCLSSYNGSKEQLHRLRVAIKKIKAVFKLANALDKRVKYDKAFAPYRAVFKAAGPIREEQLLHEELKALIKTGQVKSHAAIINRLNQQFGKQIAGYIDNISQRAEKAEKSLHALPEMEVAGYCGSLLKKLHKRWPKLQTKKDYHEVRKELKQLQYCVQLLSKSERKDVISAKKLLRLDELQETIGKWHDNVLILVRLSQDKEIVPDGFTATLKLETRALYNEFLKTGNKLLK